VLGGNRKVVVNAEVLFPMPGAGQDKSLRLAWFLDGGQVYGASQSLNLGELRYAAGLALAWSSPVGPLRLSYGFPLNEQPGDRIERLQFTFGTTF
jgi:outer membrane protein insertion porin family